ncbi:MAG TPA: hypothetical protein VIL74_08985 [Pyrinomonadaceae bacterium]|jgi:hypothetical protein
MAQLHVSELMQAQQVYGGLKQADERGVLVDADLTSISAAKTAIDTDTAKMHVSEGARVGAQAKAALDKADHFVAGYTSGSDVSDHDQFPSAAQNKGQQVVY